MKQYKDFLFVNVPENAKEFMISCAQSDNDLLYKNENGYNYIASFGTTVNQYQIIGKGDEIDWDGIVEQNEIGWENYKPSYEDKAPNRLLAYKNATESGLSLLKSLGMEPGTTLVLKKQTKLK